jgi:hypothetical protein
MCGVVIYPDGEVVTTSNRNPTRRFEIANGNSKRFALFWTTAAGTTPFPFPTMLSLPTASTTRFITGAGLDGGDRRGDERARLARQVAREKTTSSHYRAPSAAARLAWGS